MYFLGKRLLTEPEGAQAQENSRHLIAKQSTTHRETEGKIE